MQKNKITQFFLADQEKQKNRWYILLLVIIPLAVYFYFGLLHLNQFETADEHLWVSNPYTGRIQQYWTAIAQKNWPETQINDKPGVTLAIISGIGMHWETDVRSKIANTQPQWTIYNPDKTLETYRLYRLPIVIANGIMSLYFFIMLWRLTKKHWLSLAAAGLIMVSPILIGISQIINPDSFLWTFSFAGILSFMLFLQDKRWWSAIIDCLLAALFLGLAFLSKYTALVFFPFLLFIMLWYLFYDYEKLIEEKTFRKKAIFASIGFPLTIVGAIGTFALLMPAALVDHQILYKAVFKFPQMQEIFILCAVVDAFIFLDAVILKSWAMRSLSHYLRFLRVILPKIAYAVMALWFLVVLANWATGSNFMHLALFNSNDDPTNIFGKLPLYQKFIIESKPVIFSVTPVVLFLMIFLWIKSLLKKSEFEYVIITLTAIFSVFYYAVIKQDLMVNIRYSIVLYPVAAALAGIGFYELVKTLKHRYALILFFLLMGASVVSINDIKPFYFNYASNLLPKNISIADSWGYGGYEALQYIQSQGGAGKMYSDYYGACPFFSGKCVMEGQTKWMKSVNIDNIDYVVSSRDGVKKNQAGLNAIAQVFSLDKPVWELDIDGRPDNYIKVYKNENPGQQ